MVGMRSPFTVVFAALVGLTGVVSVDGRPAAALGQAAKKAPDSAADAVKAAAQANVAAKTALDKAAAAETAALQAGQEVKALKAQVEQSFTNVNAKLDLLLKQNAEPRPGPKLVEPAVKTAPKAEVPHAAIYENLRKAAHEGSFWYNQGQYDIAILMYHRAVRDAEPALKDIEEETKSHGLRNRVLRPHAIDPANKVGQAIVLRTAMNDVLNAPLRKEAEALKDEKAKLANLTKRMGGDVAVLMILKDATAGMDGAGSAALNPVLLHALLGRGASENSLAFLLAGGSAMPQGGIVPAGYGYGIFTPVRDHHRAELRALEKALKSYCVPEPEVNEFVNRLFGHHHQAP